jgi:hypothetical protein
MKKLLIILVLLVVGGAYIAGYWPQHLRVVAAQENSSQLTQQLAGAQSLVRICHIENELLTVIEQTESQNYGEAQNLSGRLFDDLRTEADQVANPSYKQSLEAILGRRDAVTSGLARADAGTLVVLRQSLKELRQLMLSATT